MADDPDGEGAVVIPLRAELAERDPSTLGELIPVEPEPLPVVDVSVWETKIVPGRRDIGQWVSDCYWGARLTGRVWAIHTARSPLYYGRASRHAHRGLWRVFAAWWRWIRDHESIHLRHSIILNSTLDPAAITAQASKEREDRKRRVRHRWYATAGVAFAALVLVLWLRRDHPILLAPVIAVALLALGLIGAERGQVVEAVAIPLTKVVTSPEIIAAAIQTGYGKLDRPETHPTVPAPGVRREAGGYAFRLALAQGGRHADHVLETQALFAANLGTDNEGIDVRPVRGRGLEVDVWMTFEDVLARPSQPSPLVGLETFDVWQPLRVGTVPRGDVARISLPWSSWLIGGQPRMGKTFLLRLIGLGFVLDPHADLDLWDFKPQGDWLWAEDAAAQWTADDSPEGIKAYADHLKWLRFSELPRRRKILTDLTRSDPKRCPEGKLTPGLTRDSSLNLRLRAVITDEIQVPMSFGKIGAEIQAHKEDLARRGPAAGIKMVDSSQRMDENSVPKGLRAAYASRIALKVEDANESNLILGKPSSSGWNAAALPGEEGLEGWAIALGFGVPRGPVKFRSDLASAVDAAEVARLVLARRGPTRQVTAEPATDRVEVPEVVRTALASWPHGQMTCHQDVLAREMGWDQIDVGRAMRQAAIDTTQVKAPCFEDGVVRNRRGYYLADLEAVAR